MPGDFERVCGESVSPPSLHCSLSFSGRDRLRTIDLDQIIRLVDVQEVIHLGLLALSLAALRKAKSSSPRVATPNSEDGEKMVELDEYKNFPKDKA
jgi:hypothetical protein